jgi:hypothetical protein
MDGWMDGLVGQARRFAVGTERGGGGGCSALVPQMFLACSSDEAKRHFTSLQFTSHPPRREQGEERRVRRGVARRGEAGRRIMPMSKGNGGAASAASDLTPTDVLLFAPNLVGYVRIACTLGSLYLARTSFLWSGGLYFLAFVGDAVDGIVARKLNQCMGECLAAYISTLSALSCLLARCKSVLTTWSCSRHLSFVFRCSSGHGDGPMCHGWPAICSVRAVHGVVIFVLLSHAAGFV